MVPSPLAWMTALKAQGLPVEIWFYDKAAHGILNGPMKKETRTYGTGETANLRYGWTGSLDDVPSHYMSDIVRLIKSSYPSIERLQHAPQLEHESPARGQ